MQVIVPQRAVPGGFAVTAHLGPAGVGVAGRPLGSAPPAHAAARSQAVGQPMAPQGYALLQPQRHAAAAEARGRPPRREIQHDHPHPVGPSKERRGDHSEGDFIRLLDSLEVRVDLMAQMQQARSQIKAARARPADDPSPPPEQENVYSMGNSGPYHEDPRCSVSADSEAGQLRGHLQQVQEELERERAVSRQLRDDRAAISEAAGQTEARLARERSELWGQVEGQREIIRTLNAEIERLRDRGDQGCGQDRGCGQAVGDEMLRSQLREALAGRRESDGEVRRLKEQLLEERRLSDRAARDLYREKERLRAEIEGRPLGSARSRPSGGGAPAPAVALPTVPVPWAAAGAPPGPPPPVLPKDGEVAPFYRGCVGANVTLSGDGYTAERTKGCRQSVLLGSAPLPRQEAGHYFEVEVRETVEGWVGGLGLGVTRTAPGQLRRVPDKAWRLPQTFVVGYWGCVFLDGEERRTRWRADALQAGDRVGVLCAADGSGDLRVFVNGALAVSAEGALSGGAPGAAELYPVVDVFAATLAVSLQPVARPPPRPWDQTPEAASPPASPCGSTTSPSTGSLLG